MKKLQQGWKDNQWLGVSDYAKKHNRSRQQIYMDIRLGKIPKERIRVVKAIEVTQILDK